MNERYGPCVRMSVLMYHHVKNLDEAKAMKQEKLTVSPEIFRKQMEFLRDKGYKVIGINELVAFFELGQEIAKRSVIISFDDAYEDSYSVAWPILKGFGYTAMVFTPTGLMENPNYLSWQKIKEMAESGIYFGNHTWSHHSAKGTIEEISKEIDSADKQLAERGLNQNKIFAYPFGAANSQEVKILDEKGYKLAFTTKRGNILCQKQRLALPRIRIGNANLGAYGL